MTCAASFAVDGKTNKLSLFHVLDEIGSTSYPLQLGSFCVASLFERDPGEEPIQTYALTIGLNDVLLASFTMRLDFQGSRRNRSVNTIERLAVPAPGTLLVSVVQKTNVLAEWRIPAFKPTSKTAQKEDLRARDNKKPPVGFKARPTIN